MSLTGKSFVITGTLSRTRDEYIQIITNNGGFFKTSMVTSLSYLIVGSEPGDTKLNFARRHGIQMISEQQLLNMIGRGVSAPPKKTKRAAEKAKEKEKKNRFTSLEF